MTSLPCAVAGMIVDPALSVRAELSSPPFWAYPQEWLEGAVISSLRVYANDPSMLQCSLLTRLLIGRWLPQVQEEAGSVLWC